MRKFIFAAAMAAVVVAFQQSAKAGLTLVEGTAVGSITNGDKTFTDFTCDVTTPTGVALPSACSQISVAPFTDVLGNLGIRFHATFLANTFLGVPLSTVDVSLTYDVTAGSPKITDVHMSFNPDTTIISGSPFLLASVNEVVNETAPTVVSSLASISVSSTPKVVNAFTTFGSPITSAQISKDISLTAMQLTAADSGMVLFSNLDQTFSQTGIPEPGTIALLGTALFGFAAILRRRQKSKQV